MGRASQLGSSPAEEASTKVQRIEVLICGKRRPSIPRKKPPDWVTLVYN